MNGLWIFVYGQRVSYVLRLFVHWWTSTNGDLRLLACVAAVQATHLLNLHLRRPSESRLLNGLCVLLVIRRLRDRSPSVTQKSFPGVSSLTKRQESPVISPNCHMHFLFDVYIILLNNHILECSFVVMLDNLMSHLQGKPKHLNGFLSFASLASRNRRTFGSVGSYAGSFPTLWVYVSYFWLFPMYLSFS